MTSETLVLTHRPFYKSPLYNVQRTFENITFSIEEQLIATSRQRFENKAFLQPIPELAKEDWLARCAFPLGMDDVGNLFPTKA